jgi:hypothetical protein
MNDRKQSCWIDEWVEPIALRSLVFSKVSKDDNNNNYSVFQSSLFLFIHLLFYLPTYSFIPAMLFVIVNIPPYLCMRKQRCRETKDLLKVSQSPSQR